MRVKKDFVLHFILVAAFVIAVVFLVLYVLNKTASNSSTYIILFFVFAVIELFCLVIKQEINKRREDGNHKKNR